jgi:hypothetical protein
MNFIAKRKVANVVFFITDQKICWHSNKNTDALNALASLKKITENFTNKNSSLKGTLSRKKCTRKAYRYWEMP